jgi:drug/metabolite transporter (DMT)-like permease
MPDARCPEGLTPSIRHLASVLGTVPTKHCVLAVESCSMQGAVFMILSTFFFGTAAAFIKLASPKFSVFEIAFCRNLFGLIPALWMSMRAGSSGFRAVNVTAHIWRGLFGVASMLFIFYAYSLIPLPDATSLSFTSPLFITTFSALFLHESVGRHRWIAVLVGFLAVLIIMKPGSGVVTRGGFAALASGLFNALAMISLRKLRNTENTEVTTLYFTLLATIITGIFVPFHWKGPDLTGAAYLISIGLLSGVGQYLLTKAYGLAEASVISPFSYVMIIWATTFGILIWGDIPTSSMLIGTGIIILSGLYILHRERLRSLAGGDARPL